MNPFEPNSLDDLLTGAAQRLDDATAHVAVPSAPRPAIPVGRLAAAAVCVTAVAGGAIAIRARDHHRQRPASYPPGLLDGANGPQITLAEVPDGDDDPGTWRLEATPSGGTIERTKQEGGIATTAAGTTADTVATGPVPDAATPLYCLTAGSAGGVCPDAGEVAEMVVGPRGDDGQAFVYGLPDDTFAVTFQSAGVRFWERPMHGVALFPFPAAAATTVTFAAIDVDGRLVAGGSAGNTAMTAAEVAAAVVTTATEDTLEAGWFVEPPDGVGLGAQVIRLRGRNAVVGFRGPFTEQGYLLDAAGSAVQWVDVITLRSADVDAVRGRLERAVGGSVRSTTEVEPGVTVIVRAADGVPSSETDRAVATLGRRAPRRELVNDLDTPFAFNSERSYNFSGASPALQVLMGDVVGNVEGHEILAMSDDVGDVQFRVEVAPSNRAGVDVGPHVVDPKRLPAVGDQAFRWLWAVPGDVTSVRLTLDDGTIVTPQVVDVTAIVDARLLFVAADAGARRVVAVEAQHG
ncbi:MAG: hypothetical protein JWM12_741 [Ilumatobacteraceae bacterium]|nr:hypothetical protein [Ilumatobacteraceae bacterium]